MRRGSFCKSADERFRAIARSCSRVTRCDHALAATGDGLRCAGLPRWTFRGSTRFHGCSRSPARRLGECARPAFLAANAPTATRSSLRSALERPGLRPATRARLALLADASRGARPAPPSPARPARARALCRDDRDALARCAQRLARGARPHDVLSPTPIATGLGGTRRGRRSIASVRTSLDNAARSVPAHGAPMLVLGSDAGRLAYSTTCRRTVARRQNLTVALAYAIAITADICCCRPQTSGVRPALQSASELKSRVSNRARRGYRFVRTKRSAGAIHSPAAPPRVDAVIRLYP
jgi:hypothetical protein